MVKIISEFDIEIDDLQNALEEDQETHGYEFPKDTEETIELLSEMNLHDFSEMTETYEENLKIVKFEFESKAEKKDFEKWLKKKRKEEDSDDDDDSLNEEEEED